MEAVSRQRDFGAGASASGHDPSGKTGRTAAELERCFVFGEFRFGERLSVGRLSTRFAAGRQPLTSALAHLRSLGYVEIVPQVGCTVVSPTNGEVADFFVAMSRLEALAAGFAAARSTEDEATRLVHIADRERPSQLGSLDARRRYIANLEEYHTQLWGMARSAAVQSRVTSMRRLGSFYLWQGGWPLNPVSAHTLIAERVAVATAIASRDVEKAEALMIQHIAHKPALNALNV